MFLAAVVGATLFTASVALAQGTSDCSRGGTVVGRVVARETSALIADARVIARWAARRDIDSVEARSDTAGRFRLCGVPMGTRVHLRASDVTGESGPVDVTVAGGDSTSVVLEIEAVEAQPEGTKTFAERPDDEPLRISSPRTISLGHLRSNTGRGTIVGIVVMKESGTPLPFADLLVEPSAVTAFTSDAGTFRLVNAPASVLRVRARRIGFSATTVAVQVRANATDTVRIELPQIALQLQRVRVADAICPNRRAGTVDSAVVTILTQVRLNAERARLMARAFPFEMRLQRTVANEGYAPGLQSRRVIVDTIQVDTVSATMEHGWEYSPGAMLRAGQATGNRRLGAPERLVIPQLVDFADESFVEAHCFRYAGLETLDGRAVMRVDFEPAKGVREPVKGSLYFDQSTYQIQRSTLHLERNSPQKAGDIWVIRVDTWFRDIVPTLPVIERIAQRTTLRTAEKADAWPGQAATEVQQLIDVRFLSTPPIR